MSPKQLEGISKLRKAFLWGLPILLIIIFAAFPILTGILQIKNQKGWSTMKEGTFVKTIIFDKDGHAWVGTYDGLHIYDWETWKTYSVANSGIAGDTVYTVAFENNGDAWIGTDEGLSIYDGDTWTKFSPSNSGLAGDNPSSITFDKEGRVWIENDIKGASLVSVFDGDTWESYDPKYYGLPVMMIFDIVVSDSGDMLFGTTNGLYVFNLYEWTLVDNSFLMNEFVKQIQFDKDGRLWVMASGGIARYDGTNWEIFFDRKQFQGFDLGQLIAFAIDKDGRAWIGFKNDGLGLFDGENLTLIDNSTSGLVGDNVQILVFDPDDNLWIGTSDGISVLSLDEFSPHPSTNRFVSIFYFFGWFLVWPMIIGLLWFFIYPIALGKRIKMIVPAVLIGVVIGFIVFIIISMVGYWYGPAVFFGGVVGFIVGVICFAITLVVQWKRIR